MKTIAESYIIAVTPQRLVQHVENSYAYPVPGKDNIYKTTNLQIFKPTNLQSNKANT